MDKTSIILSSQNKQVIYINGESSIQTFPLQSAIASKNKDMVKRLKYAKEILSKLLTKKKVTNIEFS